MQNQRKGSDMWMLGIMLFSAPVLSWIVAATNERGGKPLTLVGAPLLVALGALTLAIALVGPAVVGQSRERMGRLFGVWGRGVLVLVGVHVLAEAALFVYTFYGNAPVWFLAIVAVVGMISFTVLCQVAIASFKSGPVGLRAVEAAREDHPRLFELVDDIATKVGAQPPRHVVLGLEPNFFVTNQDLLTFTSERPLGGQTMYLSLAMMRVLSTRQLAAMIGHEFGHFKGEDLAYSARFAPTYKRFNKALEALSESSKYASIDVLKRLVVQGVATCFVEFATKVRAMDRIRELEADRVGSQATDVATQASALVAVSMWAPAWGELMHASRDHIENGAWYENLSECFLEICRHNRLHIDQDATRKALVNSVQSHPFDTHPSLGQRLDALGVRIEEVFTCDLPEASAIALLADAGNVERRLTQLEGLLLCRELGKDLEAPYRLVAVRPAKGTA